MQLIDNSIELALGYSRSTKYRLSTIAAVIGTLTYGRNVS